MKHLAPNGGLNVSFGGANQLLDLREESNAGTMRFSQMAKIAVRQAYGRAFGRTRELEAIL